MSYDCIDICDAVLDILCSPCPNYKKCQNAEDEANHAQMMQCMGILTAKKKDYPDDFEPIHINCCKCGKPAEGGNRECDCVCPICGTKVFDDSTMVDHNECYDCHKAKLNGDLCEDMKGKVCSESKKKKR